MDPEIKGSFHQRDIFCTASFFGYELKLNDIKLKAFCIGKLWISLSLLSDFYILGLRHISCIEFNKLNIVATSLSKSNLFKPAFKLFFSAVPMQWVGLQNRREQEILLLQNHSCFNAFSKFQSNFGSFYLYIFFQFPFRLKCWVEKYFRPEVEFNKSCPQSILTVLKNSYFEDVLRRLLASWKL